jgi:hypothetical protein
MKTGVTEVRAGYAVAVRRTEGQWKASKCLWVTVAVVLAVTGCSDDGSDDPAVTPTITNPTTTESREAADEAALRELTEGWYETLNAVLADGEDVALAEEYITGRYLEQFQTAVAERRAEGTTSESGPASREVIESIDVDGDMAVVETCVVDDGVLRSPEGEVLDDNVYTYRFSTAAERTPDGGWRFNSRDRASEEEGDLCDEA